MRKETKVFEDTVYICGVCNKEYFLYTQAEFCEKAHKCEHTKIKYVFYDELDGPELHKKCCLCGKDLEYIRLWKLSDKSLAKLFDFAKELK
jgi:hypothetical protein